MDLEEEYDFCVFHDEEDLPIAKRILDFLESPNEEPHLRGFIEARDSHPGKTVFRNVEYAIKHSRYVLVILSKHSLENHWFELKVHASLIDKLESVERDKVIPIFTPEINQGDIPLSLQTIAGVEYEENRNSFFWTRLRNIF